ncbi:TOBE domain-containing protein [Flavobacterium gawalongense]|uniref:Tobe domain protein n=1 Tax=Flavobacterium gawalongense TaxID=2594432 RepID=A0A553BLU4_9FLAO|nr:TOBE domain-containing protein [Flavobacterium gawalongense]TRX09139.1 tobe domain protein [Flavobacterium gawalongense]TRX09226.1 tobe domain protein [Flavobacterium gawalongense]TRX26683.1 tobe domain protein [Flavobacterium gawalongense]
MNTLNGTITTIQSHEGISLVKVKSGNTIFTSIVLDSPETVSYLKTDYPVKILFKETEVIIAKDFNPNISIQNRILCSIQSIKKGVILSQINLVSDKVSIKSIITSNACNQLELKENDTVIALIKTNEVSLSPND